MPTTKSNGAAAAPQVTIQNTEEGYSSKKGDDGKEKYWCNQCPYNIESVMKAAIKRHIKTKHLPKENSPPHVKNGIKRYLKVINEGNGTEEKCPKINKTGDKIRDDNRTSEGLSNPIQHS